MDKKIEIKPVTRIEGHGSVTIFLDDKGEVKKAQFNVAGFRGFEKFCENRPFYELPRLTSRVCGICPVSHQLASSKACDQIMSVKISESAILLRRLIHMGQIIQSHALNFFYLSLPDLLCGVDSDPATRNIFELIKTNPEFIRRGIRLRSFGQKIVERLAGKRVHGSDWVVPGGVVSSINKKTAEKILLELPTALELAVDYTQFFKNKLEDFQDEIGYFGDSPAYHIGLTGEDGILEHYDGDIRVIDPDGEIFQHCKSENYNECLDETVEPWSYMKFPYLKSIGYPEGTLRTGPLARLNIVSRCGTTIADSELKQFKKSSLTADNTFMYHYARLIEVVYCIEKVEEILQNKDIYSRKTQIKGFNCVNNEGIGVIEAPRGTLIHHYKVDDDGLSCWVNIIAPTEINNLSLNKSITEVAKKTFKQGRGKKDFLNRVEAVIRSFDPCLSCATHEYGKSPLKIVTVDSRARALKK